MLLRHYLHVGGQILDFSVDQQLSDVLDGLIVVDLAKTDRRRVPARAARLGVLRLAGQTALNGPSTTRGIAAPTPSNIFYHTGSGAAINSSLLEQAIGIGALDFLIADGPRHPCARDRNILGHLGGEAWNIDEADAIEKMRRGVLGRVDA